MSIDKELETRKNPPRPETTAGHVNYESVSFLL